MSVPVLIVPSREYAMVYQNWSRYKVIAEICRLSQEGQDLRHGEIAKKYKTLVSASVRYFGSWGKAVMASGIDYDEIRRKSKSIRSAKVTKWSCERIKGEIKMLAEKGESLDAAKTRSKHPALFSAAVSSRYFGSWREALTSLGVDYDLILSIARKRAKPPPGRTHWTRTVTRWLNVFWR